MTKMPLQQAKLLLKMIQLKNNTKVKSDSKKSMFTISSLSFDIPMVEKQCSPSFSVFINIELFVKTYSSKKNYILSYINNKQLSAIANKTALPSQQIDVRTFNRPLFFLFVHIMYRHSRLSAMPTTGNFD